MTLYFTGKGDKGQSLVGNNKVSKDSLILEVLGELDEFNSLIGLAKNYLPKKYFTQLTAIQNDIFIIQANIAWFLYPKFKAPELKKEKIEFFEKEIAIIEKRIKPQENFIIYGSSQNSAWFDYLRAVARKVERKVVALNKKKRLDPVILTYLNRLSSYLYALARLTAFRQNKKEIQPWY